MQEITSYFDPTSVKVVEEFFQSNLCTSGFNFDMYIGALTAVLCCSEYCGDYEYGEIVVGNNEQGYLDFTSYESVSLLREANVTIENELGELLYNKELNFVECYLPETDAKQPLQAFADWCKGFYLIQQVVEKSWFEDFDLILYVPDFKEGEEVIEECQYLFAMIEVFADFIAALEKHENPEMLKSAVYEASGSVCEGIYTLYRIGLLLEEAKLGDVDEIENDEDAFTVEPFVRDQPKVGRNDPCPCGSGKKYKKCCA